MATDIDLDHTSFAVWDALAWATRLRRELGAIPIAGETLHDFRYLLLYVGDLDRGARIELLEPHDEGFVDRFLRRHGIGPHHLTFRVPDLRGAVEEVRHAGGTVVGEDYDHAAWQEAFIKPDSVHGVVVQLAQTDRDYPTVAELLAGDVPSPDLLPSTRGATDPHWWSSVWETPAVGKARLRATHLGSTDLGYSHTLFGDVLGGQCSEDPDGMHFAWPGGSLRVFSSKEPGVRGMSVEGGPPTGMAIGSAQLGGAA